MKGKTPHRFQKGQVPWNRGKRGIEAGWTPERRERQTERQKKWLRDNPDHPFPGLGGPSTWRTGPDPEVRRHYYRWLKSQAQARFWRQEWTLRWEDYLEIFKTAPGRWGGRDKDALHLARIDTAEGWHLWNVHLVNRGESMRRSTKDKRRITPAGLGSKKKGINWRRGGHTRNDT